MIFSVVASSNDKSSVKFILKSVVDLRKYKQDLIRTKNLGLTYIF